MPSVEVPLKDKVVAVEERVSILVEPLSQLSWVGH